MSQKLNIERKGEEVEIAKEIWEGDEILGQWERNTQRKGGDR